MQAASLRRACKSSWRSKQTAWQAAMHRHTRLCLHKHRALYVPQLQAICVVSPLVVNQALNTCKLPGQLASADAPRCLTHDERVGKKGWLITGDCVSRMLTRNHRQCLLCARRRWADMHHPGSLQWFRAACCTSRLRELPATRCFSRSSLPRRTGMQTGRGQLGHPDCII